MQTPEKARKFSTMTSHQMFTLWWEQRWVRNLVLLLTPVGIVDATFTVLLFNELGHGFEFNPLVQIALQTQWWIVWFFVDAISFFLFIMMAGSYYLYTRNSAVDNKTGLVSGLVALRVALAAHNVIRFHGVFPAVFGGFMFGSVTFIIMDSLLDRTNDVSWEGFKQWWTHRMDRRHDQKLMKRTVRASKGDISKMDEVVEKEIDAEISRAEGYGSPWKKRVIYLLAAIALFLFMPYFLVFLGEVSGVTAFTDIYGPLVFWNELSAPAFLMGFVSICIFTAVIMYLVLRSFDVQEGAW
ncbi:MAG: hypothetical protein ACFFE2_00840 [Candidatus Thorarchaeota archaeon]